MSGRSITGGFICASGAKRPEAYDVALIEPGRVTVHRVEYAYGGAIRIEGSPNYADWDRTSMKR